jgi:hypothetical protein
MVSRGGKINPNQPCHDRKQTKSKPKPAKNGSSPFLLALRKLGCSFLASASSALANLTGQKQAGWTGKLNKKYAAQPNERPATRLVCFLKAN